jgi:hypothetical protein
MRRHKHVEQMTLREFKTFRTSIDAKYNNYSIGRKINHILRTEPEDKFRGAEIAAWTKLIKQC